jgi:subtilisin family serine protease
MTTPPEPGTASSRRLLTNGEALRMEVEAPPSGGGQKYEPQTPQQAQALLLPQIQSVTAVARQLPRELRAERLYIEARLLPNYIAASYFPIALLAQIGAVPVGSRADSGLYRTKTREIMTGTRRLVLTVDDRGLAALEQLIERGGRTRTESQAFAEIRKLDEISIPGPESIILARPDQAEEQITWEAVLHPAATAIGREPQPLDEETMAKWYELVSAAGGQVYRDYVRRVGGLTFSPVSLDERGADQVARFNPLRAIRPMPSIRPRPRFGTRVTARLRPPSDTNPIRQGPEVAVFDGGVDPLNPSVLCPRSTGDLTKEPSDPDDLQHGTAVTGAVLYGLVRPGDQAPRPPLPVDSFRVLPAPDIPGDLNGYWVLDRIKETVANSQYKIVNLSLGPVQAVEEAMEPDRWTSELDQLAWENDILFVVAAGNDGDKDRATGLHRVQIPADMANGLSVGAADAPPPDKPWARAWYSSMGPGRQGNRIQPCGVQFGGDLDTKPFPVICADGRFLDSEGTSFAAPLVTHALADLATRIPRVNANVLRAFAIHFAERHRKYKSLQDELGYGRYPLTFADDLDCAPGEVHVLYVDEINRGELLGYQIPIPRGSGAVEVVITLAYSSPVEPTQPTEYTSAALELAFRPHHLRYRFSPPKGHGGGSVELDVTSEEARRLLEQGWQMSQEPVTKGLGKSGVSSETLLRDTGKWETLRTSRINLADGDSSDPRLEISYVARRAGALDNSPTSVPFALLVTVTDKSGGTDLYERTVKQFVALRPVPSVQTQIRVRGGSTWH